MSALAARTASSLGTIKEVVKGGVGYLADLFSNLVRGIQGLAIAPLALALGCQSATEASTKPQPAAEAVAATADAGVEQTTPRQLGKFNITFYYVIGEDEVKSKKKAKPPVRVEKAVANDNQLADDTDGLVEGEAELAAVAPPDLVPIYGPGKTTCKPIAEVTREFAQQLRVQGTGKLRDGRVLNVWGHCSCATSPCFKVTALQWGNAGTGRPLHPFRTVAVDPKVIKLGSLLYIPQLEGRTMPGRAPWGGFVHDGCVVADDTGGGIRGKQLDLFVGRKGWFFGLSGRRGSHSWARHVPVFDGAKICERKGRRVAKKSGAI